jgi:hypothetical protein
MGFLWDESISHKSCLELIVSQRGCVMQHHHFLRCQAYTCEHGGFQQKKEMNATCIQF